jgi:hypothetical protein
MKNPSRRRGDRRLGLPSSGRLRNKTLTLRAVPATLCFGYDLSRGREADVHVLLLDRLSPRGGFKNKLWRVNVSASLRSSCARDGIFFEVP